MHLAEPPPRWIRAALLAACALLLGLTHLALFLGETEFPHFSDLTTNLAAIESGHWLRRAPELWETSLRLGGPLYYWTNLPALMLGQPVFAIHLWMALLELAGLGAWLWLGARHRLGPGFTWGGAILLAFYAGPKSVVCENMTVAVLLAIPLFASAAAGLCRSGWWRWLLPGFLFGYMVQVHNATLMVGLALLLALLLEPRQFLGRAAGFLAGWAPLILLALFKPGAGAAPELPRFAGELASGFDAAATLEFAARALGDPLLLLGIALLFSRQVRDRLPAGLARLALLWLLCTDLLLSGVLQTIGRDGGAVLQYALLNPARATLAGIALAWLAGLPRGLLPWLASRRLVVPAALLLAALGMAGWRGWQAAENRTEFAQEYAEAHRDPCACDLWKRRGFSRFAWRYQGALWEKGLPKTSSPRVEVAGPMDNSLGAAIYWLQREKPGWKESYRNSMPVTLLASPHLSGLDLAKLPGAVDYGPYVIVPGMETVEVASRKESLSYQISPGQAGSQGGLIFLVVDGTRKGPGEATYTLTRGGETVVPLASCSCADQSRKVAGWFAYDLGAGSDAEVNFKARGPVVVHHVTAGVVKKQPRKNGDGGKLD